MLPKCQQCAELKSFNGQYLSYWLKKLKTKGHGYCESADNKHFQKATEIVYEEQDITKHNPL